MSYINRYWLYAVYLLVSLLSFFWPVFLLFLIFIFPLCLLAPIRKKNFLYSLFLIFSLNSLLFIFYMALANLLKIPLYDSTIAGINLAAAIGLTIARFRGKSINTIKVPFHGNDFPYLLAIYGLFIVAFIVRVISIIKFPAPILHDPVADSIWTKSLLSSHSITYFYSPGIHLITGFFSRAASLSIPHALNIVTNSFNAFSVLSWGLVTLLVTRKRLLALLVAFLTFIVPVPSMLYVNSGKNSLIMAIAFAPIVFYALDRLYRERNLFNSLALFICLASLFLIHYPTFGYVFLTAGALMVLPHLPFIKRSSELVSYRSSRLIWLPIGLALLFLAAWFILQHKGLAQNNAVAQPTNYSQSLSISLPELKNSFINNYREFATYSRTYSTYYMPIMVVGLIYFFSRRRDRFWLAAAFFTFWVFAVPFLVRLLQLNTYDIIRSSGVLLFFQAFTFVVALGIYHTSISVKSETWSRYYYAAIALVILGWFSYSQFHNYRTKTLSLEAVDSYNLAAYSWINNNHIKGNFLINEVKASNSPIIFPSDGGMWIPVYTNDDVSDNFANAQKARDKSTYKLYTDIKSGTMVKQNLAQLIQRGYTYYYYDKGIFGAPLNPANIDGYSSLLYSNKEVSIYKLL